MVGFFWADVDGMGFLTGAFFAVVEAMGAFFGAAPGMAFLVPMAWETIVVDFTAMYLMVWILVGDQSWDVRESF